MTACAVRQRSPWCFGRASQNRNTNTNTNTRTRRKTRTATPKGTKPNGQQTKRKDRPVWMTAKCDKVEVYFPFCEEAFLCACVHVCMCACVHVCMCACLSVGMCLCLCLCRINQRSVLFVCRTAWLSVHRRVGWPGHPPDTHKGQRYGIIVRPPQY